MKKIKLIFILFIATVFFTSCDDIKQIMSVLPKFDTELPNVISGKYAYFHDSKEKDYTELFTFDSSKMEVTYHIAGSEIQKGTYSYVYEDFNITICNGILSIVFEDGTQSNYGFLYEATAVDGQSTLTLNRNGEEKTYEYKGK